MRACGPLGVTGGATDSGVMESFAILEEPMSLRPIIGERRDRGTRYLLITIVAFAITVIATRTYLDVTGYPKIGGGGLHVAHML